MSQFEPQSDVQNDDVANIEMYPNPTDGPFLYLVTDVPGKKEVNIFDVFGEVVFSQSIMDDRLNISTLDPGVYILQLRQGPQLFTRKLVVK